MSDIEIEGKRGRKKKKKIKWGLISVRVVVACMCVIYKNVTVQLNAIKGQASGGLMK